LKIRQWFTGQRSRRPRRYADPHDRAVAELCGLSFDRRHRRDQDPPSPPDEPPKFHIHEDGGGGATVTCHNCGSTATSFDPADGWSCSNCGASDSDE
jgi:hypothetical protein